MNQAGFWAACAAAALIAGCAMEPRQDGGIVGTGNRIECDEQVAKDATRPAAEHCKRE